MTKVIKGEFKKIKDVKVEDVSLTCDTSLEVFNNEVNRLSGMDDDLFTYEVEVANIPCDSKMDDDSEHEADDDMGYDPSDVAFTEWLGSKFFNYKTMDHYTMKALWIYWIRGDDEVELTDEEFSDDKDKLSETYLLRTLRDSRPMKITRMIGSMNGTRMYHGWMDDGYCNGGNSPGTYIIVNQLHYQDYEWYEALEDSKLRDEALRNKAIMEGFINEDKPRYKQKRRWNIYTNYDDAYEIKREKNYVKFIRCRMTKVIKGEFEKIMDVKVKDVSLTCDTPVEVFNNEVSRLSRMNDDLFTYEVEVANIPCNSNMDDNSEHEADDDMGYDPSDVAFTEWLGSKIFNYKTMDHYTIKALWIYWIRGDDKVELTNEESSDDMDEVAEV
ncbi:hypothetical protein Tco_0620050 [Tanacetum coccineum]